MTTEAIAIPPFLFDFLQLNKLDTSKWDGKQFNDHEADIALQAYYVGLDANSERITLLEDGYSMEALEVMNKCMELSAVLAMLRNADADLENSKDLQRRLNAQRIKGKIYAEIDRSLGQIAKQVMQ